MVPNVHCEKNNRLVAIFASEMTLFTNVILESNSSKLLCYFVSKFYYQKQGKIPSLVAKFASYTKLTEKLPDY